MYRLLHSPLPFESTDYAFFNIPASRPEGLSSSSASSLSPLPLSSRRALESNSFLFFRHPVTSPRGPASSETYGHQHLPTKKFLERPST